MRSFDNILTLRFNLDRFSFEQQYDNDGGGLEELDDYDALNEETFGSATNDDWEGQHENLVLLDSNGNTSGKEKDETDDGDLGDLGKNAFFLFFLLIVQ